MLAQDLLASRLSTHAWNYECTAHGEKAKLEVCGHTLSLRLRSWPYPCRRCEQCKKPRLPYNTAAVASAASTGGIPG